MDPEEPSYDTEESERGSVYIYGMGFFFGFFLLITISYVSYICKRHRRFRSSPQTTISYAATSNDTENNQHVIKFSRGIDEDVLVTFPTFVYSEVTMGQKEEDSTNANSSSCSICLADYKAADVVRLLPECGHLFHIKCIDTWLKVHPTCPVCRKTPSADMAQS